MQADILCRVDLVNATSNLTKPRFLPQQAPRNDASAADEEKFEANLDAQWGPDLSSDLVTMFEGMDNRMEKLFHRVRQLSASANNMERSNVNPELQEQYNQGVHLLECQVNASIWSLSLNNIRQHGSATQSKELITVRTCCRTWHCTTLIYIHVILRKTPTSSQTVEKLGRRLRFSLQILTPKELWVYFPAQLLLWCLVIASIASAGHFDQLRLLQTLKRLREKLALNSWEAAKAILVQFTWVEHVCTRPASLIWKELDAVELWGGSDNHVTSATFCSQIPRSRQEFYLPECWNSPTWTSLSITTWIFANRIVMHLEYKLLTLRGRIFSLALEVMLGWYVL